MWKKLTVGDGKHGVNGDIKQTAIALLPRAKDAGLQPSGVIGIATAS